MEKKETSIEVIKEKVLGMETMLERFQITNNEDLAKVSDKIKDIKKFCKFIKNKKDEYVSPAKAIIEQAKLDYDPFIKQCENAEVVLKMRAVKYHDEQEEKRKADELKIAKKVETGYIKQETAINKLESLSEVKKTVSTDNGSKLCFNKRKIVVIEKPELIPDEYWIIDDVRVRKEALLKDKEGKEQIPGVVIREESRPSSR